MAPGASANPVGSHRVHLRGIQLTSGSIRSRRELTQQAEELRRLADEQSVRGEALHRRLGARELIAARTNGCAERQVRTNELCRYREDQAGLNLRVQRVKEVGEL